jgi:beta-glucosidase
MLDDRAFAFWSDSGWVVEPGEFTVRVGASSRDIRTHATVRHPGATPPV